MSAQDYELDPSSIFSINQPKIYSTYGDDTSQLTINKNNVCRLYVENWGTSTRPDTIPNGFISNKELQVLLTPKENIVSERNPYVRFMIQAIQPAFQEMAVPMKNLTQGFTTYVFGQQPATVNFSGVLLHTEFDNWSELFLSLYHSFLRASKLAELSILNKTTYQVVIKYQNKTMKGSILSLNKSSNASLEQGVQFNFSFLLKELIFNWDPSSNSRQILAQKEIQNIQDQINTGTNPRLNPSIPSDDINERALNPVFKEA